MFGSRREDNLRYAINWCVLGYPDNHEAVSTPCGGSCKSVQDTLTANLTDPSSTTAYGYCQDGSFMAGVDQCASCNALVDDQSYPSNCMSTTTHLRPYIVLSSADMTPIVLKVLKTACQQHPQPGASLGITGSIFSSNPVGSTTSNSSAEATTQSGLSVGAKVGIGLGVPAAVLSILFIFVFWYLRRHTRPTGHQRMDERWGDRYISSPLPGWSGHRADARQTVCQDEGSANYYPPPHKTSGPQYGDGGAVHERVDLQDMSVPKPKRALPAVTVDTRNLHHGRNGWNSSANSLFE